MKRNNRLHRNGKRDMRHQQAKQRQLAHDDLTQLEKIDKAGARRGQSKKELARLGFR